MSWWGYLSLENYRDRISDSDCSELSWSIYKPSTNIHPQKRSDIVLVALGVYFPLSCLSGTHPLRLGYPWVPRVTVILHGRGPQSRRWAIKVQVRLITENCSGCCCVPSWWEGFDASNADFCLTRFRRLCGCSVADLHTTPTDANHSVKHLQIKAHNTATWKYYSLLLRPTYKLPHTICIAHMKHTQIKCN